MAATYFDANVLVKLVLDEPDSPDAGSIWESADARHASPLSFIETCAAVAAAWRNHRVDDARHAEALADVEIIRGQLRRILLSDDVASQAADLARAHALKGADAVHLASALALRDPDLIFATWDQRLHDAAQAEGLRVAPAALAS